MPRTHGANKSVFLAQIFDTYEVTLWGFAQIKDDLFAHVYKALRPRLDGANVAPFITQILDSYEVTLSEIAQI